MLAIVELNSIFWSLGVNEPVDRRNLHKANVAIDVLIGTSLKGSTQLLTLSTYAIDIVSQQTGGVRIVQLSSTESTLFTSFWVGAE